MKESKPLIALQIERNRAHGRAMLEGIASYALENTDWRLVQIDPRERHGTRELSKYDGFIVRVMDNHTADVLLGSGRPVIDTYGRLDDNPLPSIRLDDNAIGKMAANALLDHHFSNFGYCGFHGLRFSDARGAAFAERVRNLGQRCLTYSHRGKSQMKDSFFRDEHADNIADAKQVAKWLKSLPEATAIFCCNDLRAYQVLRICEDAGIEVPRQVAVMGVDNDTLLCTFTNPPLSSIDTDPFELGRRAAAMLKAEMVFRGNVKAALHPPRRVVERESTEIYPHRTPWISDAMVYIRRHLSRGVSAADVITHLGYSHTMVNRIFRNEVGDSVQQEIIRLRMERACRLLRETDKTAAEIASACGYPSAQYFSHVFTRSTGLTPDVWRKGQPG